MATRAIVDDTGDLPTILCEGCNACFTVIWNRSLDTEGGVQFCPFRGDEITLFTEETTCPK